MSNPAANQQIGVAGNARYFGIPNFAVQWTGNDGATQRLLQIFSNVGKTPMATVQKAVDNNNEFVVFNRSQRMRQVKFSGKASAATMAASEALATDLPLPMDIVQIGHMVAGAFTTGAPLDPQVETTCAIVDSCSASWTPEGELVVDFEVTIYLNADGTMKVFAAVTS